MQNEKAKISQEFFHADFSNRIIEVNDSKCSVCTLKYLAQGSKFNVALSQATLSSISSILLHLEASETRRFISNWLIFESRASVGCIWTVQRVSRAPAKGYARRLRAICILSAERRANFLGRPEGNGEKRKIGDTR